MKYRQLGSNRVRVLLVQPREGTYGHQVLEVLMGLYLGRALEARVCFEPPEAIANPAVFRLRCAEVPIINGAEASIWRWWARRVNAGASAPAAVATKKAAPPNFHGVDFRECYARRPLTLNFSACEDSRLREAARKIGVDDQARIVCVHARESGFKGGPGVDSPADAQRNAEIRTYGAAMKYLQSSGFTVIRLGDSTMSAVNVPGVIDLAHAPRQTGALELHLLARSTFFIGCDSGPINAALLTGTPTLAVNVTNVVGAYPLRATDRYIPKHVYDRTVGRRLSLEELLSIEFFETRKDQERYELIDNTAQEITDAVREMIALIDSDGRRGLSAGQQRFLAAAEGLWRAPIVSHKRVKKGEPADQILGDGAICACFADTSETFAQGAR